MHIKIKNAETNAMMIINMIAAAFIAALAGLGIGGGGLLVVYLTAFAATPQLSAQGINLVFFIFSATASLFIHFRKRSINLKNVLILAIFGIIASLPGTWLSHTIDTVYLKKLFGILLITAGLLSLFQRRKK